MKTKLTVALILAILLPVVALADDNVLRLTGEIRDRATDAQLPKTHWVAYDSLDCVVDSATAGVWSYGGNNMLVQRAEFSISVPRVDATYRLVFAKDGYDTTECYYRVENIGRRELTRPIGTYYLSRTRDAIKLDEVTVTASKIKFYNKGDTIVYNADAFLLSEGSMLDALISQLPGVELKDNGQIYVNGRYVESLLLNGKDFFKGNNKVMLENLAAYTVKNIEVYEKRGDLAEFLNRNIESDKEYVMDIKLKKDYNGGWMINAEGGYGTNDRYLGRLFGLNYNAHNRFTFLANANNLGSNERPGQDAGFRFMDNANNSNSGRNNLVDGGLDYYIEKDKSKFAGNAFVQSAENRLNTTTSSVNFLPQGNNYTYSRSNNKTRNLKVDTWHLVSNSTDYLYWQVTPSYHYTNSDGSSAAAQALFDSELTGEQWMSLLDRLIIGDVTPEMRDSLINQSLRTAGNSSIRNHVATQAQAHIKFRKSADWISTDLNANYVHEHLYGHNRYLINYGDEVIPGLGQRQRNADRPNREYSIGANAQYNYVVNSKTTLSLKYGFYEYWHNHTSNLYMAQIQADATGRFDLLALDQARETLDAANSYDSRDHTSTHTITPKLERRLKVGETGTGSFIVEVPVKILTKRLDYTRGSIDVDPRRTWGLVDGATMNLSINNSSPRLYKNFSARYYLSSSAPDLVRIIDMVNDADPLNIYLGNPDLKPSMSHNLSLQYVSYNIEDQTQLIGTLSGSYIQNSITSGYALDPNTGVRRYKAYNVNGNWSAYASGNISLELGKNKQWRPYFFASVGYNKYTDMIGLGSTEPQASDAYSLIVTARPTLTFRHNGIDASIGVYGQWTHSKNNGLIGTAPSNVGYANPFVGIRAKLPAKLFIQTQLNMYNRMGMSDPALDKPQWVWNASLSFTPNQSWVISLDGFDMLRQLTPAQVTVNPQGRVETYTNTLPSYFMARVQYRISISPKKDIVKPVYFN